jgi:hypothetical protein
VIDSYSFGRIVIDGKEFTHDLIIYPDHIDSGWWRKDGHKLQIGDLSEILEVEPRLLIVGTGAYGSMEVPEETLKFLESKGIRVVVDKTLEAVNTFNDLQGQEGVVAALHLTC